MSQRTSSMTHFRGAAEEAISIMKSERGLATQFFDGALALVEEVGTEVKALLAGFDKVMEDTEKEIRDQLPVGKTLSEAVDAWAARKSGMRSALELGLNPTDFKSCRAMMDGATRLRKEKKAAASSGSNNSGGSGSNNSGGSDNGGSSPESNDVPTLHSVTSKFSVEVQAKIEAFLHNLEDLSVEGQLNTMKYAEGTIGKLKNKGGRWLNLKTA